MAFSLTATVSSTSITLSDGNPYTLVSASGMGGADIRRVTVRGPAQDGDTDVGYRLGPREIELVIGISATSDTLLDGYRDTLTSFFKPLVSTPIKLRVTRDDGEIRQIDTFLVGNIKIDLLTAHRPGHYHRATIRLRASDPAWYELAPGTASFVGTVTFATNWWLAGGAIGTAQVLMHGGTPAANEAWSYGGSIPATTSWTLAVRAGSVSSAGTQSFMFESGTVAVGDYAAAFGVAGTAQYGTAYPWFIWSGANLLSRYSLAVGTVSYVFNSDPNGFDIAGHIYDWKTTWYPNSSSAETSILGNNSYIPGGTVMKWRTRGWTGAVQLYALYTPALSYSQREAVFSYMAGIAGSVATSLTIAYEGDLPEYPVISLTGPIANPVITNTATGDTLDFTGTTIGAGTTYVIDTRDGYKQVLQGTTTKVDQLSDDSDLGTWHLAPNPIATGGTNTITVYGSGNGSATALSIVYYNRFMSF